MVFVLACILLSLLTAPLPLSETLNRWAVPFHELCLAASPPGPYEVFYSALVCGSNLPQSDFFTALQKTSLLHLAIVSGSHLVLLEVILMRLIPFGSTTRRIVILLLVIYTLCTGAQPPAVRAMVTLLIQSISNQWKLNWSGNLLTLYSGMATWALFPNWAHSFSFLLSWAASLGLCVYSTGKVDALRDQWRTHFLTYLLLTPVIAPFAFMHPATILLNWLIGPILGLIFFPASLATFLLPPLAHLVNWMWISAEWLLIFVADLLPSIEVSFKAQAIHLWSYLFFIHLTLIAFEKWRSILR